MKISIRLKQAKEFLVKTSWLKGDLYEFKGAKIIATCAVGALFKTSSSESLRCLEAVENCLPSGCSMLSHYNDDASTTKEDILELFDNAIAIEEAEEDFRKIKRVSKC